jgi:hypothetical protein
LENARRRREVSVGGRGRWVVGSGDCRVVKLVSSEVRRLVDREREKVSGLVFWPLWFCDGDK